MSSNKDSFTIKLISFFVFIFLGEAIYAQALINGIVPDTSIRLLELFQIKDNKKVKVADYQLDKNREFAFVVSVKTPGCVYITDAVRKYSTVSEADIPGDLSARLYLHPDESITIQLERQQCIVTDVSEQNKLLSEWYGISAPVMNRVREKNNLSIESFNNFKAKATAFKQKIKTNDPVFNKQMLMIIDLDVDQAGMYQFTPFAHIKYTAEKLQSFLHQKRFTDAAILNLDDCIPVMKNFAQVSAINDSLLHKSKLKNMGTALALIPNDTLKGFFVSVAMEKINDYAVFSKNIKPYKKYMVTEDLQKTFEAKEKLLSGEGALAIGKPAYNFSLEDVNGKTVTMKDLQGKIVLVDAWATWCGPCKAQIPFLKKLEEEMKGRDIAFVSVSIDVPEAKQAWKTMVQNEKLGGIQLIDDNKKSFHDFYKLFTIPRFMIFNKEGKIINTDAPRPSDHELKKVLEKVLADK